MLPEFLLAFGLIAIILVITALASGIVERSPLSFPILFLGLGFLLGERGLGLIQMGPHDPILEVVATLTLSLVLFLDAVNLQIEELGRRWLIPALILGPGTAIIIALGALPIALLLGFGWVVAFIGGAILASTDPVVLRELVRDPRIPRSVRQILKIEAGTNDIIVLPVILVLIAVAQAQGRDMAGWGAFLAQLLLLGPAIGFAIGGLGSWLMSRVDARMNIRREHQSLYGIGLVLAAYTAATVAGGDGFLAAFAAGLAVTVLNQSLCDCFLEYGEVTSEMAMLLAFVLFGAVLSSILDTINIPLALGLAAIIIFAIRPPGTQLSVAGAADGASGNTGFRDAPGHGWNCSAGLGYAPRSQRHAGGPLVRAPGSQRDPARRAGEYGGRSNRPGPSPGTVCYTRGIRGIENRPNTAGHPGRPLPFQL